MDDKAVCFVRKKNRRSPRKHKVHTKHPRYKVKSFDRGRGGENKNSLRIRPRKRTVYTPLREFAKMGVLKGSPTLIQQKDRMFYADWSIVEPVEKIIKMGFETWASCSGTVRDHVDKKGREHDETYLSMILPKDVASYEDGSIKDQSYVDALIKAGKGAGWTYQLQNKNVDISQSMYPMFTFRYKRRGSSDEEKVGKWDDLVRELGKIKLSK